MSSITGIAFAFSCAVIFSSILPAIKLFHFWLAGGEFGRNADCASAVMWAAIFFGVVFFITLNVLGSALKDERVMNRQRANANDK